MFSAWQKKLLISLAKKYLTPEMIIGFLHRFEKITENELTHERVDQVAVWLGIDPTRYHKVE